MLSDEMSILPGKATSRVAFGFMLLKESIFEKTHSSENLPPAFAEAASRRQVAPLCQRGVIPPFVKGG